MLLSILIPEYNQPCMELIKDLQQQCESENIPYEIIVMDDGSTNTDSLNINRCIGQIPNCIFYEQVNNHGRSHTRNQLMKMAKGKYFLFVDSDAQIGKSDFIHQYVQLLPTQSVICGGIFHESSLNKSNTTLRYRYEKWAERRMTSERRQEHPYEHLRTFNYLIPAHIAHSHPFDENITLYGYEDVLQGKSFENDGVEIIHIDNPLCNSHLEENSEFLHKTEESLHTLKQFEDALQSKSSLLALYHRLQRFHLIPLIRLCYACTKPILRINLHSSHPSLLLFQFYKLGYYAHLR